MDPLALEEPLFERLAALGIVTTTLRHPPVRTVEEAKAHRADLPGCHVKNLFLRDKKRSLWALTALEDRPIVLRDLRPVLGARGGPTFASEELLRERWGVAPGAVTPFGALHDREGEVQVVLDAALRAHERVCCHPLHNEATTSIRVDDLVAFLRDTGHEPLWLDLEGPLPRPSGS